VVAPSAVLLQIVKVSLPKDKQGVKKVTLFLKKKNKEIGEGIWYSTEGAVTREKQLHQLWCGALGSEIISSGFAMEVLSVRWGAPATEVLKSICRVFYRLEASGIFTKLGDQGLFLPVLMLAGKQLVVCVTEKTHKDRMFRNVSKYFAFRGGKEEENIFFTFFSLSPFLFTLSASF